VTLGPALSAAEAAVFETFVVPRYLSFFGSLAMGLVLPHASASVVHVGCRTGYPDGALAELLPGATLVGVDPSPSAIDLARTKAALYSGLRASYQTGEIFPTPLAEATFSHAITIHPICDTETRKRLLAELRRLLAPGGQALVALPLRGSFPEIGDMLREFALRQDSAEVAKAADIASASRPSLETVVEEFEGAGLGDVDVDVQLIAVSFDGGREFLDDPIAKLIVMPEAHATLKLDAAVLEPALKYARDAIAKYWSEGVFELTVNVGAVSARRP
jgi:SAM-dependent methyltransferase